MNIQLRKRTLLKKHDVFLLKLAELLQEGYTFTEAVSILMPHYTTNLQQAQHIFEQGLQAGEPVHEILLQLGIEANHLLLIELASYHSDIEHVLQTSAKQMALRIELERQTRKKMMYPIFLFVGLFVSLLLFRQYFLPNMTTLFAARNEQQQLWSSALFLKLPDILLVITAITALVLFFGRKWLMKQSPKMQLQVLQTIPFVKQRYATAHTLTLAYILSGFLSSGVSLQTALDHVEQQRKSPLLSYIAVQLKALVLQGTALSSAVIQLPYFRQDFTTYITHGEHHGQIAVELQLYARILEQQQRERQQLFLSMIQPIIFAVVAICIVGAYLAILLPMYEMINIM